MFRLQVHEPIPKALQILVLASLIVACTSGSLSRPSYREELYRNECADGVSSRDFPLTVRWCLKLDLPIRSSPKIKDEILYINTTDATTKSVFYAIDAKTSTILWRYETEAGIGDRSFLWDVVGDYVILGGRHQFGSLIEVLDRRTGQRIWQTQIDYLVEAIVTDNERLYVVAQDALYQQDSSNGKILWTFKGLPSHATFRAFYIPANKTIVVPVDYYYVIDAQSGNLIYKGSEVYSSEPLDAVVHNDSLVYGGGVVNAVDGTLREGLPGGTDYVVPVVISNTVYYVDQGDTTNTAQLISRDLATNDVDWAYSAGIALTSSPGNVFISDPVVLNNALYVFTKDDKLHAISLGTGHEIGQWYGPKSGITLSPQDGVHFVPPPLGMAASNTSLYVSLGTNLLYAFEER